jgi:hypothetical protein
MNTENTTKYWALYETINTGPIADGCLTFQINWELTEGIESSADSEKTITPDVQPGTRTRVGKISQEIETWEELCGSDPAFRSTRGS